MIRMKNETFDPITFELSSIEIEMLLSAINPDKYSGGLLKEAAIDVQKRLQAAKDKAAPKPVIRML